MSFNVEVDSDNRERIKSPLSGRTGNFERRMGVSPMNGHEREAHATASER
jgi:hypothetical protein